MTESEKAARNQAIIDAVLADPAVPYSELAKRHGIARQNVSRIVARYRAQHPEFVKRKRQKAYTCKAPGCGTKFFGVRGYDGSAARYCPRHRRTGLRGG